MIPILLDDTKTLTALLADKSNGLGRLNALTCTVTEERNGMYEMSMTLSVDDLHYSDLHTGSIVRVKAGETTGLQMFRVYLISKPFNGIVTVNARHITYDLAKAPVLPFTSTGANASMRALVSHLGATYEFSAQSDIANTTSRFTLDIPRTFRECLGGYQGSILDVFGGEYLWDNLTVKLLAHRGADNGYAIKYGKNLVDLEQEENIESVYNAVLGYAVVDDVTTSGTVQLAYETSAPKVKIVDFSDEFDDETAPTVARLNTLAQQYIERNDIGVPHVNLKVSFVGLWQTDEYKDVAVLERVNLCDTVHVQFERLGVDATAKVIQTTYDVINERYTEIQLGDAQSSLSDVIRETATTAVEQDDTRSFLSSYIQSFTDIITNSLGLFTSRVQKGNGGYQYYLHNRPELSESQYQWTINAGGFALSTDYGQTWSAGIDSQGNAVFNSLSANIIKAMEMYGATITFGTTNTVTASPSSTGVQFVGDGTIGFYSSGRYNLYNYNDAGRTKEANHIVMYTGTSNSAEMYNYDSDGNAKNCVDLEIKATGKRTAVLKNCDNATNGINQVRLETEGTTSRIGILNSDVNSYTTSANAVTLLRQQQNSETVNTLDAVNYDASDSTKTANSLHFSSSPSQNLCQLRNYQNGGDLASAINLVRNTSGNAITQQVYNNGSVVSSIAIGQSDVDLRASNNAYLRSTNGDAYLYVGSDGYLHVKTDGVGYKLGWVTFFDRDGVLHRVLETVL